MADDSQPGAPRSIHAELERQAHHAPESFARTAEPAGEIARSVRRTGRLIVEESQPANF